MKRGLIAFIFFTIHVTTANSQEDTSLNARLNAVLEATRKSDYNKVLDHTYPKLYELITREKMLEVLQTAYDNEDFSITLDSVNAIKIYPIFAVEGERYTVAEYSMRMQMKFKELIDSTDEDAVNEREEMATFMEEKFGEGNVRYDMNKDAIVIREISKLIAIKTKADNRWYFVNYDEDNPQILNFLFSKPVIEKIGTYK